MPKLQNSNNQLSVRLILNTDGANVCKSPATSAWPLFIAVADLPPKIRQAFENIVLAALFVGQSIPDFDSFFEHIERQLSGSDIVKYK